VFRTIGTNLELQKAQTESCRHLDILPYRHPASNFDGTSS